MHSNMLKMDPDNSARGLPGSELRSAAGVEEAAIAAPVPDDGPAPMQQPAPKQASEQSSHVAGKLPTLACTR